MADEKEIKMKRTILDTLEAEEFDALIEAYADRAEPDALSFEARWIKRPAVWLRKP
jgi:hypothetical protein